MVADVHRKMLPALSLPPTGQWYGHAACMLWCAGNLVYNVDKEALGLGLFRGAAGWSKAQAGSMAKCGVVHCPPIAAGHIVIVAAHTGQGTARIWRLSNGSSPGGKVDPAL